MGSARCCAVIKVGDQPNGAKMSAKPDLRVVGETRPWTALCLDRMNGAIAVTADV